MPWPRMPCSKEDQEKVIEFLREADGPQGPKDCSAKNSFCSTVQKCHREARGAGQNDTVSDHPIPSLVVPEPTRILCRPPRWR